jgi:hypothetical protein
MKIRTIVIFFILAGALIFSATFYIKRFLNKDVKPKPHEFSMSIEAIKNVVLVEDKNLKTWSILDYDTKLKTDLTIATYGKQQ